MAAPITMKAMLVECQRELGMRKSVYARRVSANQMSQSDADRKIAIMQAMIEHFTPLAAAEDAEAAAAEPGLF